MVLARALLDTSVVIDYPAVLLDRVAAEASISTITLAELAFGLHSPDPLVNAAREQRYHWVRTSFDPVPFDEGAARVYGALCADVRAAGRDPGPRRFDLLIAAAAVSLGLPLITRNGRDFAGLHSSLNLVSLS